MEQIKLRTVNFYSIVQVKEKEAFYCCPDVSIRSAEDAYKIQKDVLALHERAQEVFAVFSLNAKNKLSGVHELFKGDVTTSIVSPRVVFQAALLNNASAIIAFHNHPSGDPTPSKEDIEVTKRLHKCGEIIGIPILDHIIVGDDGRYKSLREYAEEIWF